MRLLCALDLEDHPGGVVTEASSWAQRLGATLDLLYVDGHHLGGRFVLDPAVNELMRKEYDRLRKRDYQMLEALRETLPEANRGTVHVEAGPPAQVVLEAAAGYDALLISTRGRTGLSHFWLGSVAERIVRSATVPVVVLRVADPA